MQYWPIFLLATDGRLELSGFDRDLPRPCAAVVHIRSRHWGTGYAYESSRAVIDHAFDTLRAASSLFAGHNPKNDASRQLLSKLGFRHTHDEYYPPTGLMHPSYTLPRPHGG